MLPEHITLMARRWPQNASTARLLSALRAFHAGEQGAVLHLQAEQHPVIPPPQDVVGHRVRTVLYVGGNGGMEDVYRLAARSLGWHLDYTEQGPLPKSHPSLIVVITGTCSHPLMEAAQRLAEARSIPITYLRSHGVSALRRALEGP